MNKRLFLISIMVTALLSFESAQSDIAVIGEMGGAVETFDLALGLGQIAVGRSDGVIVLADAESLALGDMLGRHDQSVLSVRFSADDSQLLTSSLDETVRLWDVAGRQQTAILQGHTGAVWIAQFAPEPGIVVSAGADKSIRVWDVKSQKEIRRFTEHGALIRCVVFSPDGKYMASGDDSGLIVVRKWQSDEPGVQLDRHEGKARQLVFLPDHKLATSSSDGTVRLWDLQSGTQIRKLQAHTIGRHGKVYALAFNSDFTRFVTGSEDTTAKLWDGSTWAYLDHYIGHTEHISTAEFAEGDTFLYTGSLDGTIRKWSVSPTN